jgi:hypothetical protein
MATKTLEDTGYHTLSDYTALWGEVVYQEEAEFTYRFENFFHPFAGSGPTTRPTAGSSVSRRPFTARSRSGTDAPTGCCAGSCSPRARWCCAAP